MIYVGDIIQFNFNSFLATSCVYAIKYTRCGKKIYVCVYNDIKCNVNENDVICVLQSVVGILPLINNSMSFITNNRMRFRCEYDNLFFNDDITHNLNIIHTYTKRNKNIVIFDVDIVDDSYTYGHESFQVISHDNNYYRRDGHTPYNKKITVWNDWYSVERKTVNVVEFI